MLTPQDITRLSTNEHISLYNADAVLAVTTDGPQLVLPPLPKDATLETVELDLTLLGDSGELFAMSLAFTAKNSVKVVGQKCWNKLPLI